MSASCWKASCAATLPPCLAEAPNPEPSERSVARRPNYGQQRAEVNRSKQAKQEAKQREKEEAVARRKAERDAPAAGTAPQPEDQKQD